MSRRTKVASASCEGDRADRLVAAVHVAVEDRIEVEAEAAAEVMDVREVVAFHDSDSNPHEKVV